MGDKARLLHILESINEIENYIIGSNREEFYENSMMKFASIKHLEIIGEASNHLSHELKDGFSEIQWRQIVGMRNIFVHEYFGIDTDIVWQIISKDLPLLKGTIIKMLETIT
jgi:uncharacterized protein with HEPN domain